MTTLNVSVMMDQKVETVSLVICLDARASWGCAPVAIAKVRRHRVGFLVILDDKRHKGQKSDLKVVSYGK